MNDDRPSEKAFAVLKVLYEECEKNPQLSLTGIPEQVLGKKAGERFGMIYSQIYEMESLGFVARIGRYVPRIGKNVIITQKGREYIESVERKIPESHESTGIWKWLIANAWKIIIGVAIAVIAYLIAAYITGQWKP